MFKRFASTTTNLDAFEQSVEVDLLNEQIRQLDNCRLGSFLIRPSLHTGALKDLLRAHEVHVARSATHKLVTSTVGDVVWVEEVSGPLRVAEVLLHIDCKPLPANFTGLASLVRFYEARGDSYMATDVQRVIPLEWIVSSASYSKTSSGVRVLRPGFARLAWEEKPKTILDVLACRNAI